MQNKLRKTRVTLRSAGNLLSTNKVYILILPLLLGCGGKAATGAPTSAAAEPAAAPTEHFTQIPVVGDFSLKDVDGQPHALSDYLGKKVIVISYFATWCEPCRKELVQLEKLYQAYKDKNVLVLAVAMDLPETRADVRPLVKQQGFTFPVLIDEDLKAADLFNPKREAPFGLVIDLAKNQIWSHMGYVPGDEKTLESVLLEALGNSAAATDTEASDETEVDVGATKGDLADHAEDI